MARPGPNSARFTILIIDDDPGFLDLANELLSGDGHRVLVASSGQDALAMVQAIRPDLILLDYFMPEMNGLTVLERLRTVDPVASVRGIPVVALTSGTAEDANRLSRAGSVGFILKPFEPAEFLRLVTGILNATVGRSRRRIEGAE